MFRLTFPSLSAPCLFALLLASLFLPPLASPLLAKGPAPYKIPFQVKAGDRFVITLKKQRSMTKKGVERKTPEVTSIYDGEFVKTIPGGYWMAWTLRKTEIGGGGAGGAFAGLRKKFSALSMFRNIPLQVQTDLAGAPVKIIDFGATIEKVANAMKKQGGANKRMVAMVRRMYNKMGERTAAMVLFKDAMALSMFQNKSLLLGEDYVIPAEAPNPLGGPPIRLHQQLSLFSVNNSTHMAHYRFKSRLDPKSMESSMKRTLTKMLSSIRDARRRAVAQKALGDRMQMEKTVKASADVSLDDGWVRRMEMVENITISTPKEQRLRRDTTSITITRLK